jgi:hypothetical protein
LAYAGTSMVLLSTGPSRQKRIGHCQTPKEKGHTTKKNERSLRKNP